ncbi:cupredoxin domain-containing protein [Candidatus Nitrosocosmicus sp. T]
MTLLTNYYYLSGAYAQIGLTPVPTPQEVIPTYVIDIPAGAASNDLDVNYYPEEVAIPSGTTVAWFNDDPGQIHTVTSGPPNSSNAGQEFNSGILPFGSSFQLTFTGPGDYTYFDKLDTSNNATIHVSDSFENGNFYKLSSGADIIQSESGAMWTLDKNQFDRVLLNVQPLDMQINEIAPVTYNVKLFNNASEILVDHNFLTLGSDLQIELISDDNINKTTIYGPDFTDPITGAYHIADNFGDGDYRLQAQMLSIGQDSVKDKQMIDEFEGKIISP